MQTALKRSRQVMLNNWIQKGEYFTYYKDTVGHQIFFCDSATSEKKSSKPVLVLIHGFPTASIDWQHMWKALEHHFRLITLDMIGFGLSDKPLDYSYSIFDQGDVIQALLNYLKIEEFHLLAHDYGDTVAQELLARSLDNLNTPKSDSEKSQFNILSTILLNGGLFPEAHRPVLTQKLLISSVGKWLIKLYSFNKLRKTFSHICKNTLADDELKVYWHLLELNNGLAVMPKLIGYMKERRQYRDRWVKALQQADGAIRVIDGVDDPISGRHMLDRYRELIHQPDVIELTGVGHYPQVEAPQQVLAAALDFWQQHEIVKFPN
jgi:pimeloyl-ACP methyl ester carboxylesterase